MCGQKRYRPLPEVFLVFDLALFPFIFMRIEILSKIVNSVKMAERPTHCSVKEVRVPQELFCLGTACKSNRWFTFGSGALWVHKMAGWRATHALRIYITAAIIATASGGLDKTMGAPSGIPKAPRVK